MKKIYRYDPNEFTHLKIVMVEDNYSLKDDELEELPLQFLTPAKLVDGKIVSATLEESIAAMSETAQTLKAAPLPVNNVQQKINQNLMKQVLNLTVQNNNLMQNTNMLQKQNQMLSKTILNLSLQQQQQKLINQNLMKTTLLKK